MPAKRFMIEQHSDCAHIENDVNNVRINVCATIYKSGAETYTVETIIRKVDTEKIILSQSKSFKKDVGRTQCTRIAKADVKSFVRYIKEDLASLKGKS